MKKVKMVGQPVLASRSRVRAKLLSEAGVGFILDPADLDEENLREKKKELSPDALAIFLAEEKACCVSQKRQGDLVIGVDQILFFEGQVSAKPRDMEMARRNLLRFRGKTHFLHTAVACVRDGKILWQHNERSCLSMRLFSEAFLDHYLRSSGAAILESVGAYFFEGLGVQLFEKVEGDYFSILGLPLLPLLSFLRSEFILLS